MAKPVFKSYTQGQSVLFPASLDEKLPADSPARLINHIVDSLDISRVIDTYKFGGRSAYHPRMMLKVVIYGYLNNIYSCRKIENALNDRVSFMWLSGNQAPDHNTINRFRSSHLKDTIHEIFTQVVVMLVGMEYLSLEPAYIDGTKIESRANRYTFVWRKSVEKNKVKLEEKIRKVLELVEEGIAQDNLPDDEPPRPLNSEELKRRIAEINRENRSKEQEKAIRTLENKHLPKLEEYEKHLETLGERNSYSRTDKAATFMRLKDDHMQNGQLKPAYNVQIATQNQFLTHYDIFPNPGDTLTLKPFMEGFRQRYGKYPVKNIADSGYGSEENYEFMEQNSIEAFVKYNYFHKEQTKSFKNNGFLAQNLYYNPEGDYYVCPMGQHMEKVGTTTRKSESGYQSHLSVYQAKNCTGCPLRCLCHKAKENRSMEVNHNLNRLRNKARERLTSEEGLMHRSRRPIEPEAVFGQSKSNKGYDRFRHFNDEQTDRVMMDFAIFAVAFNLEKLHRKRQDAGKKQAKAKNNPFFTGFILFCQQENNRSVKIRTSAQHNMTYAA
ncbi:MULTISPECIES: IS1182 family transposase [Proteiniphilum]|jgi:transposase|uniref:IS1182 family transposase n=1 Tax=Proteiniphilum TaxID=294702 RepID=UPI0028AB4313|nr:MULTISPECIES: IS1182 family transposase [Proteiniphilum]MDY9918118.1 IS1182 family transposase [Proteiniphilum sp.]